MNQNAMDPVSVDKRPNPVPEAIARLSIAVTDLDNALSHLVDRIRPALSPEGPNPGETDSMPSPDASELVRSISFDTERIENLIRVMMSVSDRVEL